MRNSSDGGKSDSSLLGGKVSIGKAVPKKSALAGGQGLAPGSKCEIRPTKFASACEKDIEVGSPRPSMRKKEKPGGATTWMPNSGESIVSPAIRLT